MYLYDSSTHIFEDVLPYVVGRITQAANNLRWSKIRSSERVLQCREYGRGPAQQQTRGRGWQCGYHTIINGWILALGLHPSETARFDDVAYIEARTLAVAAVSGILDWTTLVAWLLCRRLTIETTEQLHEVVAMDRRFLTTRFWANEAEQQARIDEIFQTDDAILDLLPEEQTPDVLSNNPTYDDDDAGVGSGLERRQDSLEALFRRDSLDNYSAVARNSQVPDALTFLDGFDAEGDAAVVGSPFSSQERGGRDVDRLLFLYAYRV